MVYAHPLNDYSKYERLNKCVFTREWGDNVDDWTAQNSDSRIHRWLGERAQLVQALHFAWSSYSAFNYSGLAEFQNADIDWSNWERWILTSYERLCMMPKIHIGGTLWCGFDHNRGGAAFMFNGGMMDYFRQGKYSYEMFKAQRNPKQIHPVAESGPMVFIANEMTPYSAEDVWVFSNCDEVRLTAFGKLAGSRKVRRKNYAMPSPPVVFKNAYSFMKTKAMRRNRKDKDCYLKAEGLIDGRVVVVQKKFPVDRIYKLVLKADYCKTGLTADGSDILPVICYITDKRGFPVRFNYNNVEFSVEGEAEIVGDSFIGANPRKFEWGEAPLLIRSTNKAGKVKISAKLLHPRTFRNPNAAELELITLPPFEKMLYSERRSKVVGEKKRDEKKVFKTDINVKNLHEKVKMLQEELEEYRVKEMEKIQGTTG